MENPNAIQLYSDATVDILFSSTLKALSGNIKEKAFPEAIRTLFRLFTLHHDDLELPEAILKKLTLVLLDHRFSMRVRLLCMDIIRHCRPDPLLLLETNPAAYDVKNIVLYLLPLYTSLGSRSSLEKLVSFAKQQSDQDVAVPDSYSVPYIFSILPRLKPGALRRLGFDLQTVFVQQISPPLSLPPPPKAHHGGFGYTTSSVSHTDLCAGSAAGGPYTALHTPSGLSHPHHCAQLALSSTSRVADYLANSGEELSALFVHTLTQHTIKVIGQTATAITDKAALASRLLVIGTDPASAAVAALDQALLNLTHVFQCALNPPVTKKEEKVEEEEGEGEEEGQISLEPYFSALSPALASFLAAVFPPACWKHCVCHAVISISAFVLNFRTHLKLPLPPLCKLLFDVTSAIGYHPFILTRFLGVVVTHHAFLLMPEADSILADRVLALLHMTAPTLRSTAREVIFLLEKVIAFFDASERSSLHVLTLLSHVLALPLHTATYLHKFKDTLLHNSLALPQPAPSPLALTDFFIKLSNALPDLTAPLKRLLCTNTTAHTPLLVTAFFAALRKAKNQTFLPEAVLHLLGVLPSLHYLGSDFLALAGSLIASFYQSVATPDGPTSTLHGPTAWLPSNVFQIMLLRVETLFFSEGYEGALGHLISVCCDLAHPSNSRLLFEVVEKLLFDVIARFKAFAHEPEGRAGEVLGARLTPLCTLALGSLLKTVARTHLIAPSPSPSLSPSPSAPPPEPAKDEEALHELTVPERLALLLSKIDATPVLPPRLRAKAKEAEPLLKHPSLLQGVYESPLSTPFSFPIAHSAFPLQLALSTPPAGLHNAVH